jgi:hypothetical protein
VDRNKAKLNIIIGLTMTSFATWTISDNPILGWLGTILFGFVTILWIIKFFKPNFKWIKYRDTNGGNQTKKDFETVYNDNGIFTFWDNGFTIKTNKGIETIEWTSIKSMVS